MTNSIFDIIGPIMVGPSSSHTAGAVRIGRIGRAILGGAPKHALIELHGSFAETYRGHGTDRAIIAGLLGLMPDDERIPNAFALAEQAGLGFQIGPADLGAVHPNTARLTLERNEPDRQVTVTACSVGGGSITVNRINDFEVEVAGHLPTLIAVYRDAPGIIARVTALVAVDQVNIATMRVSRERRGAMAMAIVELDQPLSGDILVAMGGVPGIQSVILVPPV